MKLNKFIVGIAFALTAIHAFSATGMGPEAVWFQPWKLSTNAEIARHYVTLGSNDVPTFSGSILRAPGADNTFILDASDVAAGSNPMLVWRNSGGGSYNLYKATRDPVTGLPSSLTVIESDNGSTRTITHALTLLGNITAPNLGTLSSQNANNVSITGGNIASSVIYQPTKTVTTNYTLALTDSLVFVDATASNIVITVPAAGTYSNVWQVSKYDATVNSVTITNTGGDLISGTGFVTLTNYNQTKLVQRRSSAEWFVAEVDKNGTDRENIYWTGDQAGPTGDSDDFTGDQLYDPTTTVNTLLVGDSITIATDYWRTMRAQLGQDYQVRDVGISGYGWEDWDSTTLLARVKPYYDVRSRRNVMIVWLGTNTLAHGHTAAEAWTYLTTFITTIRGYGYPWKLVAVNILPRVINAIPQATYDAERASFNAMLIADAASGSPHFDRYVDVASLPLMQNANVAMTGTNCTYYLDCTIHPNLAGYTTGGVCAAIVTVAKY